MKKLLLFFYGLFVLVSCNTIDYASLENRITELLNSQKGDFAIAFKNLSDGKTILINENEEFHAASTMKTPVMIEAFKKSFENEISLDDTILVKNEFKSIVDRSLFKL